MGDAQRYKVMMMNFAKMGKEERRASMQGMKDINMSIRASINTSKKRAKLSKDEIRDKKDQIAVNTDFNRQMGHFHKQRLRHDDLQKKSTNEMVDEEKKALDEAVEAEKEYTEATEDAADETEHWGQKMGEVVGEMKRGFYDALRESVAMLTAFYYKLNQNTQELMAFERELMNANSVFGITNDELFRVGDSVIQFGQKFGMEMQNGAAGLYQLASAGISANEALEMLPHTLKLSMAVQGDHNTISKLTAQTLFGFGMEMDQAAIITDKFAHAIQKSLIEYEDLSSAVKFALPFFTTTGQSIDQLLGALAVLTNRALEAGIAGRGLRQGLAELAESVGDNTAAFRKMGVEVTNEQGELLQLTEIAANFAAVLEAGVINDTELLTTLIQDLNVRGATAFVHLVQASDEFTLAVESSANAAGELQQMVEIQNQSMSAQVQILMNNVQAIFLLRDATYEGTEFMNAFHEAVITGIQSLKDLIVEGEEGAYSLTTMGQQIQDIAVTGVQSLVELVKEIIPLIKEFTDAGGLNVELLKVYLIPIQMLVKAVDLLGPGIVKLVIAMKLLSFMMPFAIFSTLKWAIVQAGAAIATLNWTTAQWALNTAIGVLLSPLILVVAGVVALAVGVAILVRHFFDLNDILHTTAAFFKHFIDFAIWIGKEWVSTVGGAIKQVGNIIVEALEGPFFVFIKFWQHFFDMLIWGWNQIFQDTEDYAKLVLLVGATMLGPFAMLLATIYLIHDGLKKIEDFSPKDVARDVAAATAKSPGKAGLIGSVVGSMIPGLGIIGGAAVGYGVSKVSKYLANGGMVTPKYAFAGALGGGPYVVGERGPELFMPSSIGRIIPNKDLNTQRVQGMLHDAFFNRGSGQGAADVASSRTFYAEVLHVGSAKLEKTKLGVDVFG